MKDNSKTNIKVGLTVIAGIILLALIISWAKNYSIHSSNQLLTVRFENVAGLEIGDPVTVNGVRKGFVEGISVKNNLVFVRISIEKDIVLKEDAKFFVMMLDLMGGKRVEVSQGISDVTIDYSIEQRGEFLSDIPSVMAVVGSMMGELPALLTDIKSAVAGINSFITDDELNKDIKQTLKNSNNLTSQLNEMISTQKGMIEELISNANNLTQNANQLIDANSEGVTKLLNQLNEVTQKTSEILTKADDLFNETKKMENNAGKLLYDDKFLTDLKETLKNVQDLTNTLNTQLEKEGIKVNAKINLF
ncbi:MAG: MCE family protein [Ignavibacteriaceae bacterium]|nr:MCE family protein [Ignavibacteriaceae bacterium]